MIQIDPEFQALIPPLAPEERRQLEENLRRDGCRDPLVVWRGVLLDGHNRLAVCQAHGLPYQTVEQPCADRDAAKAWIIRHQLGRRNLQPYQRGELVTALEPLLAAEAHARMVAGVADPVMNSSQGQKTRAALAKIAGVSEQTMDRVKALQKHAPEEVKVALRQGKTSINRAYKQLAVVPSRRRAPKPKPKPVTSQKDAPTPTLSYGERVRAEIRARTRQVQGEALTLEELAARWQVHTDIARRYLREAAALGDVIEDGPRFTVVHAPPVVETFKRQMHREIRARRKGARDGYHKWRPDNVHTQNQSALLDWIEEEMCVPDDVVPAEARVAQ